MIRNEKLKKIDEDYNKGIRHGQRLGATPQANYMSKPEFVRRENKITTAPSRDLNALAVPQQPAPKAQPRRLSYLVGITEQDERSFEKLYDEKKTGGVLQSMSFAGVMPGMDSSPVAR